MQKQNTTTAKETGKLTEEEIDIRAEVQQLKDRMYSLQDGEGDLEKVNNGTSKSIILILYTRK